MMRLQLMQAIGRNGRLGQITSVYQEDGRWYGVIDHDYEIDLTGAKEVHDLRTGKSWAEVNV